MPVFPTCCVPAHVLVHGRVPSPPAPDPAMVRDLAERSPDCATTLAVPAVLASAVTAAPERAPDPSTPGTWAAPAKDLSGAHLPLTAVTAENPG